MQQLNLLKAKQKALVEQIEKEKIQSNKGSSYKLLVEQAKLKQATSKVRVRQPVCCSVSSILLLLVEEVMVVVKMVEIEVVMVVVYLSVT